MRRPVLLTVIALGSALTLAGAGGTLAVFSDTAKTGTNTITSGAMASPVALQLGTWDRSAGTCNGLSDDLTTGLYSVTDLQKNGNAVPGTPFCVKNTGTVTAALSAKAVDYTSLEVGCTNDEPDYDTSCGEAAAGELGDTGHLSVSPALSCEPSTTYGASEFATVHAWATTAKALGDIASGQTRCFVTSFGYNPTLEQAAAAQSDNVSWRFAFTSTAS